MDAVAQVEQQKQQKPVPIVLLVLDTEEHSERQMALDNVKVSIRSAGMKTRRVTQTDKVGVGFVKTFNRGIERLLGKSYDWDYVFIKSGDGRCEQEGWLARLVEVADFDSLFGFISPGMKCGTSPQKNSGPGMPPGYETVLHPCFGGSIIRREVLEAVGRLNEDYFHYGADYEFVNLAREQGWKAVWVHDVWFEHDWIPGSEAYPEWYEHDQALYYSRWDRQGKRLNEAYPKTKE